MESDNEKLMRLQDDYLNGNQKAWGDLWALSFEITKKMIYKERAAKGFYLDDSDFEDKAIHAVEYVLRRYKNPKRKNYRITKSFTSALYYGVAHALYYRTKSDRIVHFVDDDTLRRIQDYCVYF